MMGFSAKQVQALKRNLDRRHVRTRQANGRELSYIEGWHAVAEANRIFGFDGWSRETTESKCVLARENRGSFLAVYIARVRITVHAGRSTTIREGHGTGEGRGPSPGEVHDIALKSAETDATKRALATFGKPFGLSLYGNGKMLPVAKSPTPEPNGIDPNGQHSFARDDTTPILRPSRYYGRRQDQVSREISLGKQARDHIRGPGISPSVATSIATAGPGLQREPDPSIVPSQPDLPAGPVDKSALTIGEPKRLRDKDHLRFVATNPCTVCGRQPSDPHHLQFAQPRALGLKVSDEFTVPLCRGHHRHLHQAGNEVAWWRRQNISPLPIAEKFWHETHPKTSLGRDEIRLEEQKKSLGDLSGLPAKD
jgi:DNA recombination protein Rad52